MISKKDIEREIQSMMKEKEEIKGHMNTNPFSLANRRYGVDIFSVCIKGSGDNRYLYLAGIFKLGVMNLLMRLGIYSKKVHGQDVMIQKTGSIIHPISMKEIKDLVNNYLHQLPPLEVSIQDLEETFSKKAQIEIFYRQVNMVLSESFLEFLTNEESEILRDTSDTSYVFFENAVVSINKEGIQKLGYAEIEGKVIWKDTIVNFELGKTDKIESQFSKFICNVSASDVVRVNALKSAIGYLLHSYHRRSGGQMVILYDESITDLDNPQGGTGKGVIANAVLLIRKTVKIDGKKIKGDGRFDFQEVTVSTQVLWMDDMAKHFDIDRFNSISTDGFNVEQKFKDSLKIPPEFSPKIIICSNVILDCTGSTRKRRQYTIELSNFYSSKISSGVEEPIIDEHGGRFFSEDWNNEEWNRFYWFLLDCVHYYMQNGLVNNPSINVLENRSRQVVGEEMHQWLIDQSFEENKLYDVKKLFLEYKELFDDSSSLTRRGFSNDLKRFFALNNQKIEFLTKSVKGTKVSYFRISN